MHKTHIPNLDHPAPAEKGGVKKKRRGNVLRLGLWLRGTHADQLAALALKHDTQPGRLANRLLREALDLAARGTDR